MDIDTDSAKVAFPPPLVYIGLLLTGLAADRILPWSLSCSMLIRYAVAIPLIVAGLLLIITAAGLFQKAGTDVKPWKATTMLVEHGIYSFTRNPMYLGMALLYAGLAVGFESLGALILLPLAIAIIGTQVIAREERYLEAKFGDSYRAYKAQVRRWL